MTALFQADEEDAIATLSDDVGGLWCRPIAVLESPPDSFTFLRDFVHPNVPCIIKNAILSNSNIKPSGFTTTTTTTTEPLTLTLDEIIQHVKEDTKLTVDITPDGHGDCIRNVIVEEEEEGANNNNQHGLNVKGKQQRKMFVKPHEESMKIGTFRDMLRRGERSRRSHDSHDDADGMKMKQLCHEKFNENASSSSSSKGIVPKKVIDGNGLEVFPLRSHSKNSKTCTSDDAIDIEHEYSDTECFVNEDRAPVVYYSRQNDCLRTELSTLFTIPNLFPPTIPFAQAAFHTGPPDAINLWIGNERSTSSMHKDHYENLFYVCSGRKEFVLCPPGDVLFLYEGEFSCGTFGREEKMGGDEEEGKSGGLVGGDESWIVVGDRDDDDGDDDGVEGVDQNCSKVKTRWIEPDIKKYMEKKSKKNAPTITNNNNDDDDEEFPLLSKAHPIKVHVEEGEMLYIPSLWYHRVTQTCETVGVNYWYDMKFDGPNWCYFNFLQNLKKL